MLLVQGLVLVFTVVLWWIARRDLAARAVPPVPGVPPAETADLEQLCATLETLVTDLSRRLEAVEARLPNLRASKMPPAKPEPASEEAITFVSLPETVPAPEAVPAPAVAPELPLDTRYAPVYALLASGLSDPAEIARRTGLGRGEVDLILSLRGRRAL